MNVICSTFLWQRRLRFTLLVGDCCAGGFSLRRTRGKESREARNRRVIAAAGGSRRPTTHGPPSAGGGSPTRSSSPAVAGGGGRWGVAHQAVVTEGVRSYWSPTPSLPVLPPLLGEEAVFYSQLVLPGVGFPAATGRACQGGRWWRRRRRRRPATAAAAAAAVNQRRGRQWRPWAAMLRRRSAWRRTVGRRATPTATRAVAAAVGVGVRGGGGGGGDRGEGGGPVQGQAELGRRHARRRSQGGQGRQNARAPGPDASRTNRPRGVPAVVLRLDSSGRLSPRPHPLHPSRSPRGPATGRLPPRPPPPRRQ